jgi:hypothetical protein
MGGPRAQLRAFAALTSLLVFALFASTASARPWSGAADTVVVTWQSPTPAEGAQVAGAAGGKVTISLAAAATGGTLLNVHIGSQGLPAGASLTGKDGNPATATFVWSPTAGQAGTHSVTFTATSTATPGVGADPRRIAIVVRAAGAPPKPPRPKPKAKPKPKRPAIRILSGVNNTYRWAKLLRRSVARSAPNRSARVVDAIPFLTPENTQNVVALLESRRLRSGEWIKIRLATLPNSSVGWVRRGDLGAFRLVRTRLIVNRQALTATLYRAGKKVFQAPVGVGQSQWPTPRGEYYIRMKLCCYGNPIYGPYAFGLSARSAVLTDWPGGGFIGIHGTNAPGLIPGRISHGCVRMRNEHITRLNSLMSVGTPVSVR